jgi:hypothetical protein
MAQIAEVLGYEADAARYRDVFAETKAAFGARYLFGSKLPVVTLPPSRMRRQMDDADAISRGNLAVVDYGPVESRVFNSELFTPTQTAYILALHFDLLPQEFRPQAVAELVADIERRDMHLSAGFAGSSYLPHALSANDRADIAYALLNQTTWPSWLYPVTQGATTIWERWDGWTEDNGFQSPAMNSFNHYAYGAIGAWLYNTVAGIEIDPANPGYKHIIFRPQPGGRLTEARGSLVSLYGEIISHWKLDNGTFTYTVTVPPNTTGTVYLPITGNVAMNAAVVSGSVHDVAPGTHQFVVGRSST